MSHAPANAPHRYRVFGLDFASEVKLPELFEADQGQPADVGISEGTIEIADDLPPGPHQVDDGILLVIKNVARYLVAGGSTIVIERRPDASEKNVRLYLLGSAIGILLHQRGLLPLHANAIEIDGKAVAFMGKPGAGKSTLAAWFHDRGYRLLADDVCVVGFGSDSRPCAYPGLPRLRLWQDAMRATGRDPDEYPLSVEGAVDYDKRDVALDRENVVTEPRELAAIVQLSRSQQQLRPLHGASAIDAVFANTYRGAYVNLTNSSREHWAAAVRLVQAVPVFCGGGELTGDNHDHLFEPLLEQLGRLLSKDQQRA